MTDINTIISLCKRRGFIFPGSEIYGGLPKPRGYGPLGGEFTQPKQFNLMLKTYLGPAEEKANEVYFRPETAQAMFVDFKNVADSMRKRLPFGIAQIGKAFRNEITPGNFIFRMREFEQMEIEYFVREEDWQKYFDHWLGEMRNTKR